nr:ubiquinone biosynthesis O-methyltransferase, mitochondrial [Onthophagus taurus]
MLLSKLIRSNSLKNLFFLSIRNYSVQSTTVDDGEIEHFKHYSSTWWDEMGMMKTLHSLNKLRVPLIREGLLESDPKHNLKNCFNPLKGFKILDVGCGGGLLSEPLSRLGAEVTGIDASKDLIQVATQHSHKDNKLKDLNYFCTSIEEFANDDKNKCVFDGVVASEIIEHVCDHQRFISECVQCLKPGGSIFVTTMNKTLLAKCLGIFVVEDLVGLVPKGTHDYEKFIEPHVIQRLLEENNCRTKLIHGMLYNYFTNSWSWIQGTSICYALHAVKL